jgi:hypothetical protein
MPVSRVLWDPLSSYKQRQWIIMVEKRFVDMEKRRSERKSISLNAELAGEGISCSGVVENICEYGLHLITASKNHSSSFIPEETFELKVKNASGTEACLHCEVRWVHINKTPIHGLTYRMGMEVLKQPPEYNEVYNVLK